MTYVLQEIQAYVDKALGGNASSDPFEVSAALQSIQINDILVAMT